MNNILLKKKNEVCRKKVVQFYGSAFWMKSEYFRILQLDESKLSVTFPPSHD